MTSEENDAIFVPSIKRKLLHYLKLNETGDCAKKLFVIQKNGLRELVALRHKPLAENLREQPGVKRGDDDGDGVGENLAPQRIDELTHF